MTISISRDDASARTKDISLACQVSRPDTRQGRREMLQSMMTWLQDAAVQRRLVLLLVLNHPLSTLTVEQSSSVVLH